MTHNLRLFMGLVFLGFSLFLPLLGLLVVKMELSIAAKGTIIGLLTVGGPEIFGVLAVITLGKKNFERLKGKILTWLKRLQPAGHVSRTRYRLGLIMFLLPLVPTYIMAYAPHLLPDQSSARLYVNLGADLLFVTSLFVLGGDFWDKLRALFVYDARAQFSAPEGGDIDGS